MKKNLKVGDLVRDKLNSGDGSYGLGVVVAASDQLCVQDPPQRDPRESSSARKTDYLFGGTGPEAKEAPPLPGKRYDVYFTKFERTITFHGDYLEKV